MDCDVAIIGAGVVGLAVAGELAGHGRSLYVLEKEATFGTGVSSRNSEVIHAGIYYPPGSLKAKLCLEGRELLYCLCVRYGLPHRQTGKVIVATHAGEVGELERLLRNARASGVSSVEPLDRAELRRMEPKVCAVAGLHSPETGIIDSHALMVHLLACAQAKGAEIAYRTKVVGLEPASGGYRVHTQGPGGERFDFLAGRVVNCAGLASDTVARMAGKEYTLHYCKGDYWSVGNVRPGIVSRLIYPVPDEGRGVLGMHLTLDLSGRMKLGPDAHYIDRVEDYRVDPSQGDRFFEAASRYLPFLTRANIAPNMAGIRPKLQGEGEGFQDFLIREDLPGFVNLVGIESPGLTAALAIGRYVGRMVS